jgi:hypothetical protein
VEPSALVKSVNPSPLDQFIPHPDVAERFAIRIKAPAPLVFDTACGMDLQSLSLVRSIFWLRQKFMRATPPPRREPQGMLRELLGLGWGLLVEQPGRLIVAGAACQPWKANVVFQPIAPDRFAAYTEPDQVKIAWTFEAQALGPTLTRFVTETRAVATDATARAKFRRYWQWARFGIVAIRLLLLPAVRREAQRRWRDARPGSRTAGH